MQTIRVTIAKVDNVEVPIAEMTYRQGRKHLESGEELLKQENVENEVWITRTATTVANAMNRAIESSGVQNGSERPDTGSWTPEKVLDEFGLGTVNEIYKQILVLSGLRLAEEEPRGKAKAA